jgi:hypothetical protein
LRGSGQNDIDLESKFWGAVFGGDPKSSVEGWSGFEVTPGFGLELQQVPEDKIVKNRAHFDLYIADGELGVDRLIELGASKIQHFDKTGGAKWYVMAGPEGNEFCAITRKNQ